MVIWKQVSNRHITSKLCTVIFARKRDNFRKLCTEILFRFQWQIERWGNSKDEMVKGRVGPVCWAGYRLVVEITTE